MAVLLLIHSKGASPKSLYTKTEYLGQFQGLWGQQMGQEI